MNTTPEYPPTSPKQDYRNKAGKPGPQARNNDNRYPEPKCKTTTALCLAQMALALSGCANLPSVPSVMALPGTGLSFEQFRGDDAYCRQYAYIQIGGTTANQAATESGLASAATGTAVGAAAGAAMGGGSGAAIGAGTGLLAGSVIGSASAGQSMHATQQYYDMAYSQCMYGKGHRIPIFGEFSADHSRRSTAPAVNIPPPPPGSPPPPPFR